MTVDRILFNGPVLRTLKNVSEFLSIGVRRDISGLSFDVAPSAEFGFARFAFGNGVVGVVVGQLNDGSTAVEALKIHLNLVSHRYPPQIGDEVA